MSSSQTPPETTPLTSSTRRTVLGLDLARQTGYAIMVDGIFTEYGKIELDMNEDHYNFIFLTNQLDELHSQYRFDHVGFEDAFRQEGRANELFQGWKWAVKVYFGMRGVPIYPITPSALMKHATGKGAKVRHEDYVVRANEKWNLNLDIANHDQAVAMFVADYVNNLLEGD